MVASRLHPPFFNPLFSSNCPPPQSPSRSTFLVLSAGPEGTAEPAKDRQKVVRIAWEKLLRWSRSWRSKARTDVLERTNKVPSQSPCNSFGLRLYFLLWLFHFCFSCGFCIWVCRFVSSSWVVRSFMKSHYWIRGKSCNVRLDLRGSLWIRPYSIMRKKPRIP